MSYKAYNFLFDYLKSEKITIDEVEFTYQLHSHPEFGSLLAISDTLKFFKIENAAFKIEPEQISELPDSFICEFKTDEIRKELRFVQLKNGEYTSYNNGKPSILPKNEFIEKFTGIVLLVEKGEEFQIEKPKNPKTSRFIITAIISLMSFTFLFFNHRTSLLFFILAILGLYFSIQALNNVFGIESKIISLVCNNTTKTSCDLQQSNKWGIFKIIDFTDISLIFFSFQIISLLLFNLTDQQYQYLKLNSILLGLSLPAIITSLFYQKFIVKKWCPICLFIISILTIQIILTVFLTNDLTTIVSNINFFLSAIFVMFSMFLGWHSIKEVLLSQKELKEHKLKSVRFMRNYNIFESVLKTSEKLDFPSTNKIVLGDPKSNLTISLFSSLTCAPCKRTNEIFEKILKNHKDIKIDIYFNVNFEFADKTKLQLYRGIINTFLLHGANRFRQLSTEIHQTHNYDLFNRMEFKNLTEIDSILKFQRNVCVSKNILYTPAIFINGYKFPQWYEPEQLDYLINDLKDNDLNQ